MTNSASELESSGADARRQKSNSRFRRRRRRMATVSIRIGLSLAFVWLAGDLIYSRVVLFQLDRYERTFQWDERGVRVGEQAFETGSGETALLLVHGINFSPIAYRNLAPALAAEGCRCRAMRLPGFGLHVRQYADYRAADWIEAVDQEIGSLAADHVRVVLVAHSLGAAIALRCLAERRPAISGIVLLAPAIEVSNARSPLLPTRTWHEFARRTLLFTRIVLSPFPYDMRDPVAAASIPQKQFTPRGIVDQTFALIDANRGAAATFTTPLLMILSPTDQVIDSASAERYFAAWGSTHKQLVWQPESGHMIPLDYGWENAAAAIAEFARTLPTAGSRLEASDVDSG